MRFCFFSFALSLLLIYTPLQAEVYRWVDDKGVTHFGDRPPSASSAQTETTQVNLRSKHFFDHVKPLIPIRYQGQGKPSLILFEQMSINIRQANRDDEQIGIRTSVTASNCSSPVPINLKDEAVAISENRMMGDIVLAFKDEGYRLTAGNLLQISHASSKLVLSAEVSRIRLEVCEQEQYRTKQHMQKAAAYFHINWKLSDRQTHRVIYSTATEGMDNSFDRFVPDAVQKSMSHALSMAAKNLLADKLFVKHIPPAVKPPDS